MMSLRMGHGARRNVGGFRVAGVSEQSASWRLPGQRRCSWWRAGAVHAVVWAALLGGGAACHADSFYEEGFTGTITSATGMLAPLCPAGNCNNVSGTMLIDQSLIPAHGTVYLNPMFYDFSAYDIDEPVNDFFTLDVAGDVTGYFGHHGSTAGFVFTDGVFTGIEIDQDGYVPGTSQFYDLEMNGATFTGVPYIGYFYETGPLELTGTINPG